MCANLLTKTDQTNPQKSKKSIYNQTLAFLLNSIPAKTLQSVTEIGQLSDGTTLDFERMRSFDGHVKIHLANEGPDYEVILVAGNVGPKSMLGFDREQLSICGNSY